MAATPGLTSCSPACSVSPHCSGRSKQTSQEGQGRSYVGDPQSFPMERPRQDQHLLLIRSWPPSAQGPRLLQSQSSRRGPCLTRQCPRCPGSQGQEKSGHPPPAISHSLGITENWGPVVGWVHRTLHRPSVPAPAHNRQAARRDATSTPEGAPPPPCWTGVRDLPGRRSVSAER